MKIFYDDEGNITGYEIYNANKKPPTKPFIMTDQFKENEYGMVFNYKVNVQTKKLVKLDKTILNARKVKSTQQMLLWTLNNSYQSICKQTDNEYLSYQKRKEFNILTEKDKTDFEAAKKRYIDTTKKYRQIKEKIDTTVDLKELEKIKIEL
jgi:hypothetical protein